ncbi:hypothetical protein SMKI_07G0320 [Saccharomyces mikatae IFO 1815]|uniref:Uncharacterized protein n=1 Tax=Saccharomyces mikatae IFO 1815 TaxID=226126 RepID=A0AA35IZQ0_SACMI|nr:uncharacterized protein SMKI_07G0320 [Saccharomyces mikatae IFO 1815]CAI4039065.1 hypothetical protein SMKI_07G0320 [Saccharomyces mikatae IFO 1815]
MGITALTCNLLNILQAYSKKCLEHFFKLKNDALDSSTALKSKSNDSHIVEKTDKVENCNFARIKQWFLLMATKYNTLMENKFSMFFVVACFFICAIQFLFFIIYWTEIVPRKTLSAIDNLNYDYLTTHLKEQCIPYEKILDQCVS